MCGITGYIGFQEAAPILLGALKRLEYRGYDSAGVAVLGEGRLRVSKAKGDLSVLEERLGRDMPGGTLGIGHTRWATHGEPSDVNSHPHVAGRIAVVHNGIIENYRRLKEWLEARNMVFLSDTDTEVIAHLINYHYDSAGEGGLFAAVREALLQLEGSYALAVASADFPDRIVAVRKDSPLIVGQGNGENFLASDVPALLAHTREVCYLEEREITVLYRDHVDFFTGEGERIIRTPVHIEWDAEAAEKGGYEHFMLKEIHEQPRAFTDTLRPRLGLAGIAEINKAKNGAKDGEKNKTGDYDIDFEEIRFDKEETWAAAPRIVITACGTAYHAAMVGKYALEHFTRIPVEVDIASEYRYRNAVFNPADIFIIVSQSGETADTLAAMRLARKGGARVLAITNVVGSTLAREADLVLYTWAGPEIAVASTKAFTTQLMCLYLLALKLGRARSLITDEDYRRYLAALSAIPAQAEKVLGRKEAVQRFASRHYNKSKVFFMGRQFDYAVSLESALKLKEINYTHSEAFAAGELKHGPIALMDRDTLAVTIATQTRLFDKTASNIQEVRARGASSLVITWDGEESFNAIADEIFRIPKTEDAFSPLLSVIPAQLFAYYCAVLRGNNPDKPRNLAKSVTVE
jgi:glucosamine--fructose-6-phosphate aminotransferase (isomerizing)